MCAPSAVRSSTPRRRSRSRASKPRGPNRRGPAHGSLRPDLGGCPAEHGVQLGASRTAARCWVAARRRESSASSTARIRAPARTTLTIAAADQRAARARAAAPEARDPRGRSRASTRRRPGTPRHDAADLLVTDISAVAGDWMTTAKPIIVTCRPTPAAFVDADIGARRGARYSRPATPRAPPSWSARNWPAETPAGRRAAGCEHTMGDVSPGRLDARGSSRCATSSSRCAARELAARAARLTGRRAVSAATGARAGPSDDRTTARGHPAAVGARPPHGRALDRRPVHAADLAVRHPGCCCRPDQRERRHLADDRQRLARLRRRCCCWRSSGPVLAVRRAPSCR